MKSIKNHDEKTYPAMVDGHFRRLTVMTVLVDGGCGTGDLAAYRGIVDMKGYTIEGDDPYHAHRKELQQWVADVGNKLTEREATVLFPTIATTGYRR